MKTYKLGNKIKCIVRAYSKGKIGKFDIKFDNQPYTILKDVEASLTFTEKTRDSKSVFTDLAYTAENLQEITLSNVELNDKVLNMIFSPKEEIFRSDSDDSVLIKNHCFQLNSTLQVDNLYQVFVYNANGELLAATGKTDFSNNIINLETFDEYYREKHLGLEEIGLCCYSYISDNAFKFRREEDEEDEEGRKENRYFILDLVLEGNTEENEEDTPTTSFIHIGKCAVRINKNMYFNRSLNAIDLKFIIVDNVVNKDNDNESYIILEQ